MFHKKGFSYTAILPLILIGGCTSFISSKPATDDAAGMIYYLPQPFIQVTPQNDGGVKVEVVYLPDPNHRYAVKTFSIMGNYTIDINRTEEGFLETVTFNSDNSGLLKQLIDSGANLRAKEIDTKAAQVTAAKTKADTEATEQAASEKEIKKSVKDAELALQVAGSKLNLLEKLKASGEAPLDTIDASIFNAKLEVDEARVKLSAVQAAEVTFNLEAANADVGNDPVTPEPVFFKVEMTNDSVVLKQAFGHQMDRKTSSLPKAPSDVEMFDVNFAEGSSRFVQPNPKTKALSFNIIANRPYMDVMKSDNNDSVLDGVALTPWPDKRTVVVDLPKDLPEGTYDLLVDFKLKTADGTESFNKIFPITVEK